MFRTMTVTGVGRTLAIGAAALVLVARGAAAQSTIFNIPSTDTVETGKVYGELDVLPQLPGPDKGASTTLINPRIVYGLPHDVEVGLNFPIYHNGDAATKNLAYVQPNVKWKFYKNDDMGLAASAGGVLNTPINSRTGQATWGYVYGNISKKVKTGAYGPRFTVGPYGVLAVQDPGKADFVGTKGGVLAGYEQPVSGKVSIVADWFSGKNSMGYFTPGISITLPHAALLNVGYSIGNDSWKDSNATKNRYFFVYYGIVL